jgi:hypothetical protein
LPEPVGMESALTRLRLLRRSLRASRWQSRQPVYFAGKPSSEGVGIRTGLLD